MRQIATGILIALKNRDHSCINFSKAQIILQMMELKWNERTNLRRYGGDYFDRMLTYRQHAQTTARKCRKGLLLVLKATAGKGINSNSSADCIRV